MPLRVISFLLAVVLFWSGVSTIEVPRLMAPPSSDQQHVFAQASGQGEAQQGSVDDHHLDDLPAQGQSDLTSETPGLPPPPLAPGLHDGRLTQPRVLASAGLASPFLAGPLRPPSAAPLAG